MKPSFSITRKDGKTDFIYNCDFSKGIFNGGASVYSYEDIETFYLPSCMVKEMYCYSKQAKNTRKKV